MEEPMAAPTFEQLLALVEEQQARIDRLEAGAPSSYVRVTAKEDSVLSRRGLLTGAAVGAAGVVGAIVASPGVAGATGPGTFSSTTTSPAVKGTNSGKGAGVIGDASSGVGVVGASKSGIGVTGASASPASSAAAVEGTITSTTPGSYSAGVRGVNNGKAGDGVGVYGSQAGGGYGVYGFTPDGIGVVGVSTSGVGVSGQGGGSSDGVEGSAGSGSGVSGFSNSGDGVKGSSNTGAGVSGIGSSGTGASGSSTGGYGTEGISSSSYGSVGVSASGNGAYGQISADGQGGVVGRQNDPSGNWAVYAYGNIGASGTKSAVVPGLGGGHVALYCIESPECWFEDFGSARIADGSAHVKIDPEFAHTVELGEYRVFVQPEGECKGLFVADKSPTGFTVRELGSGRSDVAFSYRLVALRRDVVAPRLNRVSMPDAPVHGT